jgi:CrcB protein
MSIWILIAAGGALGSIARHALNQIVHQRFLTSTFPWGIFIVNVLGSALIGALAGLLASGRLHLLYHQRVFLVVGLLGGFTTFSSFSLDTLALFQDGHFAQAAANVLGQVGLSLLAVWLGFRLAH